MPLKLPSQGVRELEQHCAVWSSKQAQYGNTSSLWSLIRARAVVSTADLCACSCVWHRELSVMDDMGQLESQSVSRRHRILSAGARQE